MEKKRVIEEYLESRTFRIRMLTDLLGTVPKDPNVYKDYVLKRAEAAVKEGIVDEAQLEEELANIPGNNDSDDIKEKVQKEMERGYTGFLTDEIGPYISAHMVRGFLKASTEVCMEIGFIEKIKAYKKRVDGMLFVEPSHIYFTLDGEVVKKPHGTLSRSLRTVTPQGERVTIVHSDFIKAGSEAEFSVSMFPSEKSFTWVDHLYKIVQYGKYRGLGQWRGSGSMGRFEVLTVNDVPFEKML